MQVLKNMPGTAFRAVFQLNDIHVQDDEVINQMAAQIILPVQEESDINPQWDEDALIELTFRESETKRVAKKAL